MVTLIKLPMISLVHLNMQNSVKKNTVRLQIKPKSKNNNTKELEKNTS